jgi:hypothetical protein
MHEERKPDKKKRDDKGFNSTADHKITLTFYSVV